MIRACIDLILDVLSEIEQYESSEIEGWKRELRFMKMISWCHETWGYSEEEVKANVRSLLSDVEKLWKGSGLSINLTICKAADLERKLHQSKLLVEECSEADPADETLKFLDLIQRNLEDLMLCKFDGMILSVTQIEILQQKLMLLHNIFELGFHGCTDRKQMEDLKVGVHTFANRAACLAFTCSTKMADEATTAKLNLMLSDMLRSSIKPRVTDVWVLCFGVLKALKLHQSQDTLLLGRTVVDLVDLLLEKKLRHSSTDPWQILRDGLIFLLTFMADPLKGCVQDQQLTLIRNQIDVLLNEGLSLILHPDEVREDFAKGNITLCDFLMNIDLIREKIRQLYVEIPEPSLFNFPRTNSLEFFDSFLQNLAILKLKLNNDKSFIPFAKNLVIKIKEALFSLRPFLNDIYELQKEQAEFKDTWLQLIDLANQTEYIINACRPVLLHPIWYHMVCLFDILEQIEAAKRKLEKLEIQNIYNTGGLPSLRSTDKPLERASYPTKGDEVIGFEKEAEDIIDTLLWGSESLSFISIIGMGGLGKTTLAKKVYDSFSVKKHFHASAFCHVSQFQYIERLLLDILKDLMKDDNNFRCMTKDKTKEDLAHTLWKCLSGKRYLVVLDDIWDARAWDEIKESFPKQQYGSRVIFTTRSQEVASYANSIPYTLGFLSEDQSLELLKRKIFLNDDLPPDFIEVAKIISRNCKGLPLTIVVVAALLASDRPNKSWWKQIAVETSCFIEEGCRDVIGLSYNHLPENLKACFLYLSVFEEALAIRAKTVEQIWIAQGFVNKYGRKSFRKVAKEYMNDLVNRSLVIDVQRTRRGGIKTFRVHDLVRDFCRRQAEEENFIWITDENGACDSPKSERFTQYRVCYPLFGGLSSDYVDTHVAKTMDFLIQFRQVNTLIDGWLHPVIRDLKNVRVLYSEEDLLLLSDTLYLFDRVNLKYKGLLDPPKHPVTEEKVKKSKNTIRVPESICNLQNLEAFIWPLNVRLPKTIWKMKTLRHLEFYKCEIDMGDEVEYGQSRLDKMESLSRLRLSDPRSAREVLQRLPNIEKLGLEWSNYDSRWSGEVFTMDILPKLESLDIFITSSTSNFPHVIFPSILKRLVLADYSDSECVSAGLLSAIQRLPCLEVLRLRMNLKRWKVEDNDFQKLKHLNLFGCALLEEWDVSYDSFPRLEKLVMFGCSQLKEIPAFFGELPSLQSIFVSQCNHQVESSAIQIQEEQMDSGNTFNLIIV